MAALARDELLRRAADGVVVVPVGSLEQHGDHLPVGCDTILVEHLVHAAAERCTADTLVAPALWTGFSVHHMRFGASVTLTPETLLALVRETCASLRAWAPRVAIVNGHGGNRGPLIALGLELEVAVASYWELDPTAMADAAAADAGSIGHAGQAETALMLAAAPRLVGEPAAAFEPIGADRGLHAPDLGSSGVIGDPRAARPADGATLRDRLVTALASWLDRVGAS